MRRGFTSIMPWAALMVSSVAIMVLMAVFLHRLSYAEENAGANVGDNPAHNQSPTAVDDDSDREVGIHYVQYYKWKPCDLLGFSSDIPNTKADATGFADSIVANLSPWVKRYQRGNGDAREKDFHELNNDFVDAADFAYFSGHGSTGHFWFSQIKDKCDVQNIDVDGDWGNKDMEWIGLATCYSLKKKSSNLTDWHHAFDGLHLICGWHTTMHDSPNFGKYVARYLSASSYRWEVDQSWTKARDHTHGPNHGDSEIHRVLILGEAQANFADHIWGAGWVSEDYDKDKYYWWLMYPQDASKSTPRSSPSYSGRSVVIDPPHRRGPVIVAPNDLLQTSQRADIPLFKVSNRTVDQSYVLSIAASLCTQAGAFCGTPSVDYNSSTGEYYIIEDVHSLHVNQASGGWTYINTDTYMRRDAIAPTLPTPSLAKTMADAFWSTAPADTSDTYQGYAFMGLVDEDQGEVQDSSWNLNITTFYSRNHDGYPIVGGGASRNITLGDDSRLESAFFGGWRDLYSDGSLSTISLDDALQSVAASGPEITINNLPMCDTFIVDTAYLGYYEDTYTESVDELIPVWLVSGICQSEYDTSDYQLYIPADHIPPATGILKPGRDTIITTGAVAQLQGSAERGTPPYTYSWYSDVDGYLGAGSSITCSLSGGLVGDTVNHTVILDVMDAVSIHDVATVGVAVANPIRHGDANGDGTINISDAVYLIAYIFAGGSAPDPLLSGDANCNGAVNITDAVYLIAYIFSGGSAPCAGR